MNYKVGSLAALFSNKDISAFEEKNLKVCELTQNINSFCSKNVSNLNIKKKTNLKRKRTKKENKEEKSNKKRKILQNDNAKNSNTKTEKPDVTNDKISSNKTINTNKISHKIENDPSTDERTIFIGNWPIEKSKKSLKNRFSRYGNIESIRFRSVPVANVNIPKKVSAIKKQFHPNRTSMNAYIKFSDRDSAQKALEANGIVVNGHHLRVTISNLTSMYDHKRSIFIGNIDFQAEEEDIWKIFSTCGEIESVRLIRDNKTGVSRGIGYVNFKKSDSVELALKLTETDINGRILRIKRISKNSVKRKNNIQTAKTEGIAVKKPKKKDFQGTKFIQKKDKKKRKKKDLSERSTMKKKLKNIKK